MSETSSMADFAAVPQMQGFIVGDRGIDTLDNGKM